jgi:ABC-2 type transport system ATP-binding protein
MKILLNNASKRYNRQWIFQGLDYTFEPGERHALLGNNGSGKSTLLQCIAGAIQLSKGNIQYNSKEQQLEADLVFNHIGFAAPYLQLVEELTLTEHLEMHHSLRPFYTTVTISEIINTIQLKDAADKQIRYFSSGMKQRVKLALAFFTNSSVLMLDEPLSNLDKEGIGLYNQLLQNWLNNRTLIISSNDPQEYDICNLYLHLNDYK